MPLALGALLAVCALVGAGIGGPGPAHAATVLALDLPDLVQQADLIVLGRAKSRQGRWARLGKTIVTDVQFSVQRSLKGDAALGDRIRITRLGGEVEGHPVALTVPGAPIFRLGQTALVFLRRTPSSELRVVGMGQGLMVIEGEGPDAVVGPFGPGPARVTGGPDGNVKAAADVVMAPRRLAELLADVERLVAGGAAR